MSYVSKLHYSTNYKIVNMAINFPKKVLKNKCVNIHDKLSRYTLKLQVKVKVMGGGVPSSQEVLYPPPQKLQVGLFFENKSNFANFNYSQR